MLIKNANNVLTFHDKDEDDDKKDTVCYLFIDWRTITVMMMTTTMIIIIIKGMSTYPRRII